MASARNINSAKPFRRTALAYREKGWQGTLPLPPAAKEAPPRGYHGLHAPYPDDDEVEAWIRDPRFVNGNIALHLGIADGVDTLPGAEPGAKYEIVGIDVDDYVKGTGLDAKRKVGGAQLAALEAELGPLPATWVSGSRSGVSGIRYYLVPAGHAWLGKAPGGKDIDVISLANRYAIVWPSWHPEGGQYTWRHTGLVAMGEERFFDGTVDGIPDVSELPWLPEAWLLKLTRDGMKYDGDAGDIDMDLNVDEVFAWAVGAFRDEEFQCDKIQSVVKHWCDTIDGDESSHDKIAEAHWNLVAFATEGHAGWRQGMVEVEQHWINDVLKLKGKRSIEELKGEIMREKVNALRKFKAQIDSGKRRVKPICTCYIPSADEVDGHAAGIRVESNDSGGSVGSRKTSSRRTVKRAKKSSSTSRIADGGGDGSVSASSDVPLNSPDDDVDSDIDSGASSSALSDGGPGDSGGPVDDDGFGLDAVNGRDGYWPSGMPSRGTAKPPGDYDMNDRGNAYHWADLHKDNVYWVPAISQWIMWTGKDWEVGNGVAERSFKRVERRQRRYAEQCFESARRLKEAEDSDAAAMLSEAKRWMAWSNRSGNTGAIEAALKAASQRLPIEESELNKNPYVIGCKNGVLELMTKSEDEALGSVEVGAPVELKLRPVVRDDLLTLTTEIDYLEWDEMSHGEIGTDKARAADYWTSVVRSYFPDDDTRAYVQKLLGYTLLGDNRERIAVFLHGGTGTGKSTFLNAVLAAFGDYGDVVDLSIFRGDRQTNPALAAALPKRIITASEASQRNVLHSDVFKRITGNDPISAELKYSNEQVKRVPSFVPWIATNSPPRIHGADAAVNARIKVIPMHIKQFGDTRMNARLKSDLMRMAVLSWVVEGWRAYRSGGLRLGDMPAAVQAESASFTDQLSDVSEYLKEKVVRADAKMLARALKRGWSAKDWPSEWRVEVGAVFDDYISWCAEQRVSDRDIMKKNAFARQMGEFELKSQVLWSDGQSRRFYCGLQLSGPDATVLKLQKDD